MAATTLQILHVGDFELEAGALDRVPKLAAVVEGLERQHENTLIVSAGGNFFPGPLLTAGGDVGVVTALRAVQDARFGLPADVDGDGVADSFAELAAAPGRIDVAMLNAIGLHASALGNQEFELGTGMLAGAIGTEGTDGGVDGAQWLGVEFPYLAANLDVSRDANLLPLATGEIRDAAAYAPTLGDLDAAADGAKIAPAAIVTVGGERIGIIGAITPDLDIVSSPGDTAATGQGGAAALAAILQPVIDDLRAQGIDKIILLSHLRGLDASEALAPLLSGVDVIVAGGTDAPATDTYPIRTAGADGDPLLIVSTAANYEGVGRLVLTFDDDGRITFEDAEASGVFATTDATIAELWGDGAAAFAPGTKGALVADLVDAARDVIVVKDGEILGRTDVFLEAGSEHVRAEETNLGDLTTDANLAVARAFDGDVQVAITNAGAIHESIGQVLRASDGTTQFLPPAANPLAGKAAGDVSRLDVESALRFDNPLVLLTITRAQLLATLEHGLQGADPGGVSGQFAQVSGVAFSFDLDRPAGARVVSAALVDGDGNVTDVLARDGVLEGDPDAPIRIVTISFLVDGGDGYPLGRFAAAQPDFADRVDLATDAGPVGEQDALADFLTRHHAETPYAVADTSAAGDTRIENLDVRDDDVFDRPHVLVGTEIGDRLVGGAAADTLSGGEGDDRIEGAGGDDLLLGGTGFDLLSGGDGADFILAGAFGDFVDGGAGDDRLLAGNRGTDLIRGGAGHDLLHGGQDADTLEGGDGADTLSGDRGDDLLTGGAGADRFVFAPMQGRDVIADLDPGEDRILLAAGMEYRIASTPGGHALLVFADDQQVELLGWTAAEIQPVIADLVLFAM